MTKDKPKWTPEPWPTFEDATKITVGNTPIVALTEPMYERARACVNAMAGINDPEVVEGLVDALEVVVKYADMMPRSEFAQSGAVAYARAALAKARGES